MPITKKKCRVCGKPYEACQGTKENIGMFQWQEVACTPECGAKYLHLVKASRNPTQKTRYSARTKEQKSERIQAEVIASEIVPLDDNKVE